MPENASYYIDLGIEKIAAIVEASKAALDKKIKESNDEFIKRTKKELEVRGIDPTKVFGKSKGKSGSVAKLPPKYRYPDGSNKTWSGKGPQPKVIKNWLAEDKSRKLDDLLISK